MSYPVTVDGRYFTQSKLAINYCAFDLQFWSAETLAVSDPNGKVESLTAKY